MEILTTAVVEDQTLTVDQTFNIDENRFITIKELFSIEDEVYISYINELSPFSYKVIGTETLVERKRVIMSAKHFVVANQNLFN